VVAAAGDVVLAKSARLGGDPPHALSAVKRPMSPTVGDFRRTHYLPRDCIRETPPGEVERTFSPTPWRPTIPDVRRGGMLRRRWLQVLAVVWLLLGLADVWSNPRAPGGRSGQGAEAPAGRALGVSSSLPPDMFAA
jgi:hypothetical protein